MAAPTYTADLTTLSAAEVNTNWAEPTASGWTAGGTPATETDYFLQGAACVSKPFATGATGIGGAMYNNGSGITLPTDGAFFHWFYYQCPNAIAAEASGGARVIVGHDLANFYGWIVRGSDTYVYGGWLCFPVNTGVAVDYTVGTPNGTQQYIGMACNVTALSKGNAMGQDALRYGRGEMKVEFGALADGYATFAGMATYNDNSTNRFGLFQAIDGGYLYQGLMLLGSAVNAVDFRDSNASVILPVCKKVTANFNTIEVRNALSRVDWTNVIMKSLSTVSRGRFVVTDNADVNLSLCQFTGMGTFACLAGTDALNCVFRNCDQITAPGSNLSGSEVRGYIGALNTSAVVWNVATDPDGKFDNCIFEKGANAHHAIEFGTTSPLTMTLRGVTYTGFNAADAQNDSMLHIKRTTGTVTINIIGGTTPSYKSEGAAVSIVANPVTALVKVLNENSANLPDARVLLQAAAGGPFPFEVDVGITRVGALATVTHTNHGLADNDKVAISGCTQQEYNGVYTIDVTGANTYTYAVGGTPDTPATGAPKSTFVVLAGLTDVNGEITMSRVFPSNQPVSGRVRKSTTTPLYRTGPLAGTVNSSSGYSATVVMVRDD